MCPHTMWVMSPHMLQLLRCCAQWFLYSFFFFSPLNLHINWEVNALFQRKNKNEGKELPQCYGLNVCFPPKFICQNPNPQSDDVRMWGLWEVTGPEYAALLNGMRSLMKQTPPSSLTPSTIGGYKEKSGIQKKTLTCP